MVFFFFFFFLFLKGFFLSDFEEYSALPSSSSLKIGEKTSERTDQNQALYREESLDLNAKRVRIRKNGQFSGGKWMHIQETESFNSFLQRVSTKLGIQAKCVFDGDGKYLFY